MKIGTYDITLKQGATYNPSPFLWTENGIPVNLTGYTGKAQIKDTCNGVVLADLVVTITPLTGSIELYLSDENSALIPASGLTVKSKSLYQWDLFLTPSSGSSFCLLQGTCFVIPRVTVQ